MDIGSGFFLLSPFFRTDISGIATVISAWQGSHTDNRCNRPSLDRGILVNSFSREKFRVSAHSVTTQKSPGHY